MIDSEHATLEIKQFVHSLSNIIITEYPLVPIPQHFEHCKKHCVGNYIFGVCPDEIPNDYLLHNVKNIIKDNLSIDAFAIPRINTFSDLNTETGNAMYVGHRGQGYLLREPINERGWHHWPDYQVRIFKNVDYIRYGDRTHSGLCGYKQLMHLPAEEKFALVHTKTVAQQEKRLKLYDFIGND